jgi:hypothetical protein
LSDNNLNNTFNEKFTDDIHDWALQGEGNGPSALITTFSKIKYLGTKLIYSQMQGLKFRIPQAGTEVCPL